MRATMQALRQRYDGHKLLVVFQPHTHSRLDTFFDDFSTSFDGADRVLVTDLYGARSVADASAARAAAEAGGGEKQAVNDAAASARLLAERIGESTGVYTPSLQVCVCVCERRQRSAHTHTTCSTIEPKSRSYSRRTYTEPFGHVAVFFVRSRSARRSLGRRAKSSH